MRCDSGCTVADEKWLTIIMALCIIQVFILIIHGMYNIAFDLASSLWLQGSRFKSIIFYIIEQTLRRRGGVCVVPNHGTTMIIRPLMTFLNKAWFVSWNTGRSRMNESINRIESNHSDQFHVQIEAMMQRHHIAVHYALCMMHYASWCLLKLLMSVWYKCICHH